MRSALARDGPPKYERLAKGSVADAFDPRIRELLRVVHTRFCVSSRPGGVLLL
jgi:hypothetical protein